MTTVNISPEVALQEERAISAALKNRVLILAQALSEMRAVLDQRDAEVSDLKDQLARANEGNDV
jgi:predicted transcriptional regulator